jgi:hypothetical protein
LECRSRSTTSEVQLPVPLSTSNAAGRKFETGVYALM